MRIAILSRGATLYSTQRLAEAGRQCGHEVFILDTMQVAQHIGILSMPGPRRPLPTALDAMIPRIGASITMFGVAVVRHLQRRGLLTTADADGILNSRDKRRSWRLMADAGLPLPRTALLSEQTGLAAAARQVGGPPLVIKLLQGTQGQGVILARDMATARNVLRVLNRYGIREVLIQEFVAEAEGRDWRLIVIGDRCVAAMQRQAPVGEFRANLHRGASARPLQTSDDLVALAVQAASVHGLGVAGVDVIPSDRGPLLLEVNSSPGLQGIEKTTGVDVADATIAYLESLAA
ncbi:MAG: RimK family alpha-L-glutamate ligase [Chloroflexi bacterium]|jgi:ribosomal protein S6--L-glutamate ligase|nr:RimK family alpha-L-glutamate ligase [Chloroflexota bacterium]